jgi:hypothetical protein
VGSYHLRPTTYVLLREMSTSTQARGAIDAEILREALPYIRRFKGKNFVLKISGKVT